jgi:cysteine desulfurase
VGTIQPVEEISRLAGKQGVLVHTDAAQSVGKIPVHVDELGVDLLSIAGHKVYAPKGVGALFVRQGVCLRQILHGAGQEKGRRPGTENMLEIVGLGQACAVARRDMEINVERMRSTRDRLEQMITKACQPVRLNGDPERRLPNTSSLSFKDLEANRILETVGLDVAASAGAACHSDGVEISHVLQAMGIPSDWGKGTLRFSTGKMTKLDEIDRAASVVVAAVNGLRKNRKT